MPTKPVRRPGGQGWSKGLQNPRLLELDPARDAAVFLVWRVGSTQPRSFHTSEASASDVAQHFVKLGETVCVLRAEVVLKVVGTATLHHAPDRAIREGNT